MEQDIPELPVEAGPVVALAVDVDTDAGAVCPEQMGEFVYLVVIHGILGVIGVGSVKLIAGVAVFAGVIDDRETAELVDIAYRALVVACAADDLVTVIDKP